MRSDDTAFGNSRQSQSIAFVDYHLPTLSTKGVIDFQGLVRAFVRVSAHSDIGDLYIQRVVLNHLLKALGNVFSLSLFTVNRSIDLENACLCVYKCLDRLGQCFQPASEVGSLKRAGVADGFSLDRGVAGILMTLRTR